MVDIQRKIKTPLGFIRCGFLCSQLDNLIKKEEYKNGISEILKTYGHKIELISFQIKIPLYNGDNLTGGFGYIFKIEKIVEVGERIETY
jgi:hypothetical protein